MSEVEKKWDKADAEIIETWCYSDLQTKALPRLSREAYKAALRRKIEKYQEEHGDNQGPIDYTLAKMLELLDTVEPKNATA